MNNRYPTYNGIHPSHAEVKVTLTGSDIPLLETEDIADLSHASGVEVGERKSGGRVIETTAGEGKNEATLTVYAAGHVKLLRGLKAAAPLRGGTRLLTYVHFDVEVQYTPHGSPEIFLKRWKGCRIIGDNESGSEGTDAQKVEVPLHVKEIVRVIDDEEVALI